MATTINAGRVAMVVKGAWSSSTTYTKLDVVTYDGSSYVSIADSNTNQNPSTATTYWQLMATGAQSRVRPATNGMGFRELSPSASFASQVTDTNTIYVVQTDFELSSDFTMPSGCILRFDGGSIKPADGSNPTFTLTDTWLEGKVSLDVVTAGSCANEDAYMWWFNDDIDLWHTFINQVDGVIRYAYSSGEYTTTVRVQKNVDDTFIVEGNGAEIKMALRDFNLSSSGTATMFYAQPKNIDIITYDVIEEVAKGAQVIKVANITKSGNTLAIGDCIAIRDNAVASYNPIRDYRSCEYAFVTDIAPVTENDVVQYYNVKLNHPTYGRYKHISSRWVPDVEPETEPEDDNTSTDTPAVVGESIYDNSHEETGTFYIEANKFKHIHVSVKDLSLRLIDFDGTGSYAKLGTNQKPNGFAAFRAIAEVEHVECHQFATCMQLKNCMYSHVRDCICVGNRLYGEASSSASNPYDKTDCYGLVINSGQHIVVDGGRYEGGNHGITHGGSYNHQLSAINRHVSICNTQTNSIKPGWNASIDAHNDSEYITIRNNTAKGISLGGDRMTVEGNVVSDTIGITALSYNHKVVGNTCTNMEIWFKKMEKYNKVYGNWTPETTVEFLEITNNRIGSTIQVLVRVSAAYYPNAANIRILFKGNILRYRAILKPYPNGTTFAFENAGEVVVQDNDFAVQSSSCSIKGSKVHLLGNIIRGSYPTEVIGNYLNIANNIFDGSKGLQYVGEIGASAIFMLNNIGRAVQSTMFQYQPSDNAATYLRVIGNINNSSTYNYRILYFNQTAGKYSYIYCFDNVLGNQYHIYLENAKCVRYKGNVLGSNIVPPYIADYGVEVYNLDNLAIGATADRPAVSFKSKSNYQPYYDTTLKKLLVAHPYTVGSYFTSLSRNAGTHSFSAISSLNAANRYTEGAMMYVSVDRSQLRVLAFSKSNPSFSGSIKDADNKQYLDDMIVVFESTTLDGAFFVVPDVTTYPYLYSETQSGSQTHFYVYEARVYTDTNGRTPAASSGTTANRPELLASDVGFQYFDTTLAKVVVWTGSAWSEQQDALTFDSTPTSGSVKPVTSGGVYSALSLKADTTAIPSSTSDLTNDSDFVSYEVVSELPASPDSNILYLIPESSS